jgi:predicted RNA-binding Zn ribbon-like protein
MLVPMPNREMPARQSLAVSVRLKPGRDDLSLSFANTRYWRGSEPPTEQLNGFADLLTWAKDSEGLPKNAMDGWTRWARDDAAAARVFAEAIDLREAIYRSFSAVAGGEPIADKDFAALRRAVEMSPPRSLLTRIEEGFAWEVENMEASAAGLLAPVLWSAADLLTRNEALPIRRCANDKCLWLFIDQSKAGTRRWCDMNACGNRAKSRRHYLRTKQQAE